MSEGFSRWVYVCGGLPAAAKAWWLVFVRLEAGRFHNGAGVA
jgi:hypothetical protein